MASWAKRTTGFVQGPDHPREHAKRDRRVRSAAGKTQNRLERVERARPDVAEDYPQGREAQRGPAGEARRTGYRVISSTGQGANLSSRRDT